MALPPPHDVPATHTLLSDDYPATVGTFSATVAQHATVAFVRLERTELERDLDDATRCRRVWDEIRTAYTRPDERVVATFVRAFDRLSPDPPTVLRLPDEATADRVAAVLEGLVERYEPTEPDGALAG